MTNPSVPELRDGVLPVVSPAGERQPAFWRTAGKIAWRETRGTPAKFLFVILAVAIGVGALTGVRGFSESFNVMLHRDARSVLAADLTARVFGLPIPTQVAALDALAKEGIQRTWVTETISMVGSAKLPAPLLVSIKAVDPRVYPFYGKIELQPSMTLAQALDANSVVVGEDLLLRLQSKVGDMVRIGGKEFRIATVVGREPDRMSGSLNLGLRLMMSREGLERTGLLGFGSRAAQRFLFKLPPQVTIDQTRPRLKQIFPEALIADYRESHPIITRGLERSTTFLSLVSMIALIVGSLGVAMAMHSHLRQKMDSIAVMKSIGARSSQVIQIYVLQTLMLSAVGGLLGVVLSGVVQLLFPLLLTRYFSLPTEVTWNPVTLAQGLGVGLLTTLLFTLPPLLRIRRIRPNLVLRREMEETRPTWRERLRQSRVSIVTSALILAGLITVAALLAQSWRIGGYFVGGLSVSLLLLAGVAWLLLRSLRVFLRRTSASLPPTLRHGLANLYRPGNQATAVLVSLSLGVMFTLTVYLVQHSLLDQLMATAPPNLPNVFLVDITPPLKDGVVAFLKNYPALRNVEPELVPSVAARLMQVNAKPVEQIALPEGFARRFRFTRSVTFATAMPPAIKVMRGQWWKPEQAAADAEPQVSVAEDAAKVLGLKLGDRLDWEGTGVPFHARVAAVHRIEGFRISAMSEFIFTPQALNQLPVIYYGAVRMRAGEVGALQTALFQRFPTITVVNSADVMQIVQEVVDQVAQIVRFLSAFAILAGVIILAASIAGTRFRRVREVVILKTLGGTKQRIAAIFSVEFLLLGLVAGVMGSLLANAFTALLLRQKVLDGELQIALLPNLVSIALTAGIAVLAGWLASARILSQKPLEVLREE